MRFSFVRGTAMNWLLLGIFLISPTAVSAEDFGAKIKDLANPGTPAYSEAITAFLSSGGTQEALAALRGGLRSDNTEIVKAAILLSKRLGKSDLFDDLQSVALSSNHTSRIRQEAFLAANATKHPSLSEFIIKIARDKDPEMRVVGLSAALRRRLPNAIALQKAGLKDSDPQVQVNAAFNLAKADDASGRDLAKDFLIHKKKEIRLIAIRSIGLLANNEDIIILTRIKSDPKESILARSAADFGVRHMRIASVPFEQKVKAIVIGLGNRRSAEGLWATSEAAILLDANREEFIRQLRAIAQQQDSMGTYAQIYLSEQSLQ